MKVKPETIQKIKNTCKIILDYYGKYINYSMGIDEFCSTIPYRAFMNTSYDTSNANVIKVNGERLVPQDESYELYPDGSNDKTRLTAYRKVFRMLKKENENFGMTKLV